MFKTYVDIPRWDYMYYTIHDSIMQHNGWDVITTIYKPNYVRFYFSYKWFQYANVQAFKKAVKDYAKQVTYYDATASLQRLLAKGAMSSSEQYKKAIAGFANILRHPEGRDDETTVNEDGERI